MPHRNRYPLGQERDPGFGASLKSLAWRQSHPVLLDAPVERPPVFGAEQRLRRTNAFGRAGQSEPVSVDNAMEVAVALLV